MEDIIFWLIKLIAFDTSCGGEDAEACRDFIMDELSRQSVSVYPFDTEGSSRRAFHLLSEVTGDSPAAVMLHAHLDTADCGDELSWAAHPRSGLRRKGCILGTAYRRRDLIVTKIVLGQRVPFSSLLREFENQVSV